MTDHLGYRLVALDFDPKKRDATFIKCALATYIGESRDDAFSKVILHSMRRGNCLGLAYIEAWDSPSGHAVRCPPLDYYWTELKCSVKPEWFVKFPFVSKDTFDDLREWLRART